MIKKKRQQHNTAGFRTAHNSGYTPLKRRIAADVELNRPLSEAVDFC